MKLKNTFQLIFCYLILYIVIEARWIRTLPSNLKQEIKKLKKTQRDNFSDLYPFLTSIFQNSSTKIVETYCRFLLGAFKECMTKYHSEYKSHYEKWNNTEEEIRSTTPTPIMSQSTTYEKIYIRM